MWISHAEFCQRVIDSRAEVYCSQSITSDDDWEYEVERFGGIEAMKSFYANDHSGHLDAYYDHCAGG